MTEENKPNAVTLKKEKFDTASNCIIDVTEVTLTSNDDMTALTTRAKELFDQIK